MGWVALPLVCRGRNGEKQSEFRWHFESFDNSDCQRLRTKIPLSAHAKCSEDAKIRPHQSS